MQNVIKIEPPHSSPLYNAALDYVAHGWPVFPCHTVRADGVCSCRDDKCSRAGKHPVAVGSTGATLDPDQIRSWWSSYPWASPAIRTGDGLVVVDIDNKPADGRDGLANWGRLVEANGGCEETVTAITGSGGRHLFFRTAAHVRNYQSGEKLAAGIDVRGHHGYVVAPPSMHKSGASYAWAPGRAPGEIVMADAPVWLLSLVTESAPGPTTRASSVSEPKTPGTRAVLPQTLPAQIPSGTRHGTFVRLAGVLRSRGLGEVEIGAVLAEVNARRCTPPHSADDTRRIARDASRWDVGAHAPLAEALSADARRTSLSSVAMTMLRHGLNAFEIAAGLAVINANRCRPPLSVDGLLNVIEDTRWRWETMYDHAR